MRKDHGKFESRRARIVVVARHGADEVRAYWEEHGLPYVGVPDPRGKLGDLYGQERKLLKLGLMPALFVVDGGGTVRFARYGSSMSDIPANAAVLAVLDGTAGRPTGSGGAP